MSYRHGIYGQLVPSEEVITGGETVPVYIGTAPVNELTDYSKSINNPLLIKSLEDAETYLGYSSEDDWDKYTLSAAIYAHFNNAIFPIGPIIVINVYNPAVHTNVDNVASSDIIGTYDADTNKRTGIKCIDIVYEELNLIPQIISAPGFNHIPAVEKALVNACNNIGGRWKAICVTDIDTTAENIDDAKQWKQANQYSSNLEKVCWPKGKINNKPIWLSIMTIVRMQQTDFENDSIPYESPSNKPIDISSVVIGTDSMKFNILQGNQLNEKGITTAIFNGGKFVIWGPHMANYDSEATTIKAEDIFDVNIRMNQYLLNDFLARYANVVDSPMTRNDVDAILNTEQIKMNSLVADGKLLYGKIDFLAKNNLTNDILNGDFTFNTAVTNVPLGKSITNKIQYTSLGLSNLGGGTNE